MATNGQALRCMWPMKATVNTMGAESIDWLTDVKPSSAWASRHVLQYKLTASRGVMLSGLQGFPKPADINFLSKLNNLRNVWIEYPGKSLSDLTVLSTIKGLTNLHLNCRTKKDIDLSFQPLEKVWIEYCSQYNSMFQNEAVTKLVIVGYDSADLTQLAGMQGLESLTLIDSAKLKSVKGLAKLHNLRKLDVIYERTDQNLEDVREYVALIDRRINLSINGDRLYRKSDLSESEADVLIDRYGAHRLAESYVSGRARKTGKERVIGLGK